MSKHRYFCIHGHFYQPPRENPQLDQVELQPSAQPFHDWNERIYAECYAPNGNSRILDELGRIKDMVNNYAYMSFNIGPTLCSWIEEKHPYTYSRILEADKQSCARLDGHGNAIAQVYNHLIMPLATEVEKRLQISWGIADFERRFARKPEGMWLAETAIDMPTACALIEAGIRFTILAPTQALQIRRLGTENWTDVSNNDIDPRKPYRLFPRNEDGTPRTGYLDIFFYDGHLSHAVSFEHLLKGAERFGEKIASGFDLHRQEDQLVSICTDGESYGHHEPFGDMCAAYLFTELAEKLDMQAVNYGWYLANHTPEFEVELKNAFTGGTAWSCAHGTGRWKEDCGCSTGGQWGWNQKWRGPFRQALRLLAEKANETMDHLGPQHFKDWKQTKLSAVHAWIGTAEQQNQWWNEVLNPQASKSFALKLIEILRYGQYMFTSCAWFFADIRGIETIQNLRYALQALEHLESFNPNLTLRSEFLLALKEAKSNVDGQSGDNILIEANNETLPLPLFLALEEWTATLQPTENFSCLRPSAWFSLQHDSLHVQNWRIEEFVFQHTFHGDQIRIWIALENADFDFENLYFRLASSKSLKTWASEELASNNTQSLKNFFPISLPLKKLPLDFKERVALYLKNRFWKESEEDIAQHEKRLAFRNKQFTRIQWPLPTSLQEMLNILEKFHFAENLKMGLINDSLDSLHNSLKIASLLKSQGTAPYLGSNHNRLHDFLLKLGQKILSQPESTDFEKFFVLLDIIDTLQINSERYRIENLAFPLFQKVQEWAKGANLLLKIDPEHAILILERLNFSTDLAKSHFTSNMDVTA